MRLTFMTTSVIPVPTLSTQGWVRDPVSKMDYLLSHFFLSDYNQTFLYRGFVTSLPRIIEKHGSDMVAVISDLRRSLSAYLTNYYDAVEVEVTPAVALDLDPRSKIELTLRIGVSDKGSQAIYGRLLKGDNAKIDQIVKLNNG